MLPTPAGSSFELDPSWSQPTPSGGEDEPHAAPEKQPATRDSEPVSSEAQYDLSVPEGLEVSTELLAEATPIFRDLGLSNDQANKLMPLAGTLVERLEDAQIDAFEQAKVEWSREALSDPQLGGARWHETQRLVDRALNTAGAPVGSKFRTLLEETGLSNHRR